MQKLGDYENFTHTLKPDEYDSAWATFSPMWNASHMHTSHNISVMMDELQVQIHEHTWPRSPIAAANVSNSQATTDPGVLPPAASGNVQQGSSHKARRLEMFSDAANSIPERRTGESATDFFHRARQLQAECALEHLRSTNAGINSMNSVVAPAQSPQTSPLKSPGPKYITTRSLMYRTVVPSHIDILIGSEECSGKYGPWMKIWIKVRDQQKLNSFGNVIDGLPWLNYGDDDYKWYKGAWMPTELTMEMYVEGIISICEREGYSYSKSMTAFNPICISQLKIQQRPESNIFMLTGATKFLKHMWNAEYSLTYNKTVQVNPDNSIECDVEAKKIFIGFAKRIGIPVEERKIQGCGGAADPP